MDRHNDAVAAISASVRKFHAQKKPFRIYHGSTNSTRPLSFQHDKMINTSDLNHVLKVDTDARTVLVEPNVPMDLLVQATLPFGLIPPVVMEFPGITVGGGFAGTSGESSSFRHGFFEHTVKSIQVILPNGEVVEASRTERKDLFHGAASSFGTLGVTTLLELQLMEAKKYVELTYFPVSSVSQAMERIGEATNDVTVNYLDGILYARDRGVICVGRLTDVLADGIKLQTFSQPKDPWFYLHAQNILGTVPQGRSVTEVIPLADYLF